MRRFRIGHAFPENLELFHTQRNHHYSFPGGESLFSDFGHFLFYGVLIFFSAFLLIRLFSLQIIHGEENRSLSEENRVQEKLVSAPRGVFFDRNGVVLSRNIPSYVLPLADGTYRKVGREEALAIGSQEGSQSASLQVVMGREFTFPYEFSHVLGYLSEVTPREVKTGGYSMGNMIGKTGVEEQYETMLKGKKGKELIEVDAFGSPLRRLGKVDPISGSSLSLSLDAELQKTAYHALLDVSKDERSTAGERILGAVVVSNPNTGEIYALVSLPSFDGNAFVRDDLRSQKSSSLDVKEYFGDTDKPLFNRAIAGQYPPGSTFKLVTATAGLMTGKINSETLIEDVGVLEIGPYKFPNWLFLKRGEKDGFLNVVSAIKRSNDIFFYKVGGSVGLSNLELWARKFGVGEKLGVDIPGEASGLFPTDQWKQKVIGDKWYLGDTYHVAIGQGYLSVTPLQVNFWTSVIANGGKLCAPRVAKDEGRKTKDESCKDIGIKKEYIELIREGMREACATGGTGWPLFDFRVSSPRSKEKKKIVVACKTGTAEFGDPQSRTHAWFTAFAPAEDPEIAVTVLVEAGGEGSDVAAPVAKKIFESWFGR